MDERPSATADLLSAVFWMFFGGAIVYGAWTMDRLEYMNINPYTVPGLVPGILGVCIAFMGALLLIRAVRAGAPRLGDIVAERPGRRVEIVRVLVAAGLCLVYAAGFVGHGLPFWLVTAGFVTAFIFVFQFPARRADDTLLRGLFVALLCGAATAAAVTLVFQEIFLVRLP